MNGAAHRCAYCGLPCPGRSPSPRPVYCCLGCRFAAAVAQESGEAGHIRWTLTRLGVAIFFTMNVMLFAMVLWSRDLFPPPPASEQAFAQATTELFRSLCFLLSIPVLFLLGVPLAENVLEQLRQRRITTDLLLLLGVIASFISSTYAWFHGTGHLYFEVTCSVLVAVTLGRWLEAVGKQKTTQSLAELKSLLPDRVTRIAGQHEESVSPHAIRRGDLVRVRAGERIAVDGIVRRGEAAIDRQLLTGETEPICAAPGTAVAAGAVNLDGDLLIETTSDGGQGTLAAFVKRVEQATAAKDRYQHLADRMAAWFLPVVLLLAIAVFGYHFKHRGLERGIQSSLSVVLIACPCALGLATPLAVWSALGAAARHQILFRDAEALVRLAQVRLIVFDKTGTLTGSHCQVAHVVTEDDTPMRDIERWLPILVDASHHPHAVGLRHWLAASGNNEWRCRIGNDAPPVRTYPGRGIQVDLPAPTGSVRLGQLSWLSASGDHVSPQLRAAADDMASRGETTTAVAWAGRVRAVFGLGESGRPEVATTLQALTALGLETVVLTGDSSTRATLTCGQWNLSVHAELSPNAKADAIEAWRHRIGPVAMVGDGLNDAPALATADVGISLEAGSDLARQTAEICLLGNDLSRLPIAVSLARRTVAAIRANLFWAFAYNTVGIGLAATGRLHPIVSAVAMLGSSLFVIGRSLQLGQPLPNPDPQPAASGSESASDEPRPCPAPSPSLAGESP